MYIFLTPGIDFIVRQLVKFSIPCALFAISLRTLYAAAYNYSISNWILAFASVVFVPILTATRIIYKSIKDRRQAAKLGARLAPQVVGRSIGNIDVLKSLRHNFDIGYPGDGLTEICEELGPVVNVRILWSDMIFTTSPGDIKAVLATDFHNYIKGERLHKALFTVLGSGVFNSDGDMWKFHRSMTRPFFTRDRISDFELFDRHASTVISSIKDRMRSGQAIDFQDLMSRFTLDSATEFLFGHCVHSLTSGLLPYSPTTTTTTTTTTTASYIPPESNSPSATRAHQFARAFLHAQEMITSRERYGWIWPMTEVFGDKTRESMRVVRAFINPIIQDAIAKRNSEQRMNGGEKQQQQQQPHPDSHVEEGETLLDHLVRFTSDPVVLFDETFNIMIAGRDTTAATLTFVIYFLTMYPQVLVRLREEILEKVGPSRRPDYEDVKEMKYLRAVINETLRILPIVPFNTRESINATTWASPDPTKKPIYIPAGSKITYSVFMMHRRKDLWGPDAEEFDPDRFLDHRLKTYLTKNPFIFLPFNAGPRICLGQQFAYNEASFMLIRLLQQFSSVSLELDAFPPETLPPKHWAIAGGSGRRKNVEKVWPRSHLTMYSNGGLWVKMQEADNAL